MNECKTYPQLLNSTWLGQIDYQKGLKLQMSHYEDILIQKQSGVVLGLEHKAVITLGKRGILSEDVRISSREIQERNIDLAHIDRGGHATLHSPGQLVIYPIINLRHYNLSVRSFISLLVASTHAALLELGIDTFNAREEPGLYTKNGKVAFFGIRVDRGVSRHGISLNVKNDLSLFNAIKSCGIQNESFDKLEHYNSQIETRDVFNKWYNQFIKNLNQADKST